MACRWTHPWASSVRLLWKGRAAEGVYDFLRSTRVGRLVTLTLRRPPEKEEREDKEGEEGGLPPP